MDDKNVWEKNSKRLRRRAALKRFDEWLKELHSDRPLLFHLLTVAIAVALCLIAFGITALLDSLS